MKTHILEGPDGRLYEIPEDRLADFAVPGDKVRELRQRMAGRAAAPAPASAPTDHARLGELPPDHPGYAQQQAIMAAVEMARGGSATSGSGVTLNFYFGGNGAAPGDLKINVDGQPVQVGAPAAAAPDSGVEGYHMSFDENGVPVAHTEMLWGDYIDKQGNPAVGFHSHDPVSGNAQ